MCTCEDRWGILAFRLMAPIKVPLAFLLMALRSRRPAELSGAGQPASSQGLGSYRRMTLSELQDMARNRDIPYDGKAANRLRLDLAGWVPPNLTRVDRPQVYSLQDAILSFLEAEYMNVQEQAKRQDIVLKFARLQAEEIKEKVDMYWHHRSDSPSVATDRCARLIQMRLEEIDNGETGDLTGIRSQDTEEPAGWGRSRTDRDEHFGSAGSEQEGPWSDSTDRPPQVFGIQSVYLDHSDGVVAEYVWAMPEGTIVREAWNKGCPNDGRYQVLRVEDLRFLPPAQLLPDLAFPLAFSIRVVSKKAGEGEQDQQESSGSSLGGRVTTACDNKRDRDQDSRGVGAGERVGGVRGLSDGRLPASRSLQTCGLIRDALATRAALEADNRKFVMTARRQEELLRTLRREVQPNAQNNAQRPLALVQDNSRTAQVKQNINQPITVTSTNQSLHTPSQNNTRTHRRNQPRSKSSNG